LSYRTGRQRICCSETAAAAALKRHPAEESSLNVDFGMPRSLADSDVRGLNLQIPEFVAFWQLAFVNDWILFGIWLTALHWHGEQALRVKGILNARGSATPVVIHGAACRAPADASRRLAGPGARLADSGHRARAFGGAAPQVAGRVFGAGGPPRGLLSGTFRAMFGMSRPCSRVPRTTAVREGGGGPLRPGAA